MAAEAEGPSKENKAAEAKQAEEPNQGVATTTNVDLSLLDTWIDKKDVDDGDKFSFERRLEELQQPEIQKLTCREAVRTRLETFRPLTYFCKPNALSPIVCARFGWINSSLDMLRCSHCEAALCIKFDKKITKPATITRLIRKYEEKLATCHKQTCPFRFEAELHLLKKNNKTAANAPPKPQSSAPLVGLVPAHLASILPRDVWEMIEQPDSRHVLLNRFNTLSNLLNVPHDHRAGQPPKWELPEVELPEDVFSFGVEDETAIAGNDNHHHKRRSSLQRRMLGKLAFDRKNPYSALGAEHETLLSRLDDILHPPTEQEEIMAHTRAQSAWESLYEGIAALALFGWGPPSNKNNNSKTSIISSNNSKAKPLITIDEEEVRCTVIEKKDQGTDEEEEAPISLQCPLCLAKITFKLRKYDSHNRGGAAVDGDEMEGSSPTKKQKVDSNSLNPLATHRHYCPFVCGFPRRGQRKGTPAWQTIASKLFEFQESHDNDAEKENPDEKSDEATMDRLLGLLQSGVSLRPSNKDNSNDSVMVIN